MTDVTGVRARPGGRVTLRFTGTGYRALPHPARFEAWADRLLGDTAAGVSLVVLLVAGGCAAYLWQEDATVAAAGLGLICVPCLLVLLVRAATEVAGHLLLFVAVLVAVVFCPLLLFPQVRRWAKGWWRGKPHGAHPDRRIPAADVRPVAVERTGRKVTVVVVVDGRRLRYTARDGDGDALEREFRAMLSAPRPATGVGP